MVSVTLEQFQKYLKQKIKEKRYQRNQRFKVHNRNIIKLSDFCKYYKCKHFPGEGGGRGVETTITYLWRLLFMIYLSQTKVPFGNNLVSSSWRYYKCIHAPLTSWNKSNAIIVICLKLLIFRMGNKHLQKTFN